MIAIPLPVCVFPALERQRAVFGLCVLFCLADAAPPLFARLQRHTFLCDDSLAERSKALRSGRSLERGVGSNPTAVTTFFAVVVLAGLPVSLLLFSHLCPMK